MAISPFRRRLLRAVIILGIVVAAVYVAALQIVRPILRDRLQAMIADQLDARLDIGSLSYLPPYGVHVGDVSLVARGPDGADVELLRIGRLNLRLAKLPTGSGPLVIQSLEIGDPVVHLIRTPSGLVGQHTLVPQQTQTASKWKPSDMFQLRHFRLTDGRVMYEDRTQPHRPPLVWTGITADMAVAPQTAAEYSYHFTAASGDLANLDADGSMNIDQLTLHLAHCIFDAQVDPQAKQSPLPGEIQQILAHYQTAGKVQVKISGDFPLNDPAHAKYDAMIFLKDARARSVEFQTDLDHVSAAAEFFNNPDGATNVNIHRLALGCSGQELELVPGLGKVDWAAGTWNFHFDGLLNLGKNRAGLPPALRDVLARWNLTGSVGMSGSMSGRIDGSPGFSRYTVLLKPKVLTVLPPGLSRPAVLQSGSTVSIVQPGRLTMHNLIVQVGANSVRLQDAQIDLAPSLRQASLQNLDLSIFLDDDATPFQPPWSKMMDQVHPVARIGIGGTATADWSGPRPVLDYHLSAQIEDGRAAVTAWKIPLTKLGMRMELTPAALRLEQCSAQALGGRADASGQLRLEPGLAYDLSASAKDIDLKQLAESMPQKDRKPMTGRAQLRLHLADASGLGGDGDFQIEDADFWQIPVMKAIADISQVKQAMVFSQAAGIFQVRPSEIFLKQAAVNSTILGVQGYGTVGYNGQLDLHVIATPLGDWQQKIQATGNNPVSTVLGKLVGIVQEGVNLATRTGVYEVQITGPAGDPQVKKIPAPFLSQEGSKLFDRMAGGEKDLMGMLRHEPPPNGK